MFCAWFGEEQGTNNVKTDVGQVFDFVTYIRFCFLKTPEKQRIFSFMVLKCFYNERISILILLFLNQTQRFCGFHERTDKEPMGF